MNYQVENILPKKSGFILDPRTKIIIMIVIGTLIVSDYKNIYVLIGSTLTICFLLYANNEQKLSVYYLMIFIIAIIFDHYRRLMGSAVWITVLNIFLIALVLRMLPVILLASYILKTTTVGEFVEAMQRMRLTDKITIPFTVAFRFLPTIAEESRSIKYAMKMREIEFGSKRFFKEPAMLLEYKMIPLIISVVKIGEELSAAALTKGLGANNKRTSIARVGFTINDFLTLFVISVLTALAILL